MKKVLINSLNYGQLGNRLFLQAHVISCALEFGYKLYITNFREYFNYLESKKANSNIVFVQNPVICNLAKLTSLILKKFSISQNSKVYLPDYIKSIPSPIILLNKWNFYNHKLTKKHREKIISILNFDKNYYKKANNFLKSINIRDSVKIVGVHIRRGDYKTWRNGDYCFPIRTYINIIRTLRRQEDQELHFVICSDENIGSVQFDNDIDGYEISNNDFITELLILSKCDYIIGPPSTFNAWASYLGETPLFTLKSENIIPYLKDFQVNYGNIISLTE